MRLDGSFLDVELLGDFAVAFACKDELKNLLLALAEMRAGRADGKPLGDDVGKKPLAGVVRALMPG